MVSPLWKVGNKILLLTEIVGDLRQDLTLKPFLLGALA